MAVKTWIATISKPLDNNWEINTEGKKGTFWDVLKQMLLY